MKSLYINKTAQTPSVKFDLTSGIFELAGRSIPENSQVFYQSIIDWLEIYSKAPLAVTKVNINLEYFNTSSSKYLLEILHMLESINSTINIVSINWYCEYDDDEMYETGEDYKSILRLPFCILKLS